MPRNKKWNENKAKNTYQKLQPKNFSKWTLFMKLVEELHNPVLRTIQYNKSKLSNFLHQVVFLWRDFFTVKRFHFFCKIAVQLVLDFQFCNKNRQKKMIQEIKKT